jgi:hypothetical protein
VQVWCNDTTLQHIADDERYCILWQEEIDHAN